MDWFLYGSSLAFMSLWFDQERCDPCEHINGSLIWSFIYFFLSFWILTGRTQIEASIVLRHCSNPPPNHPLFQLVHSSISNHGIYGRNLATPLIFTLDYHHGEETQKEINLAAQAMCHMDLYLELWTWNAVSESPSLNHVLSAPFSPETGASLQTYLLKMPLLPVRASILLGLLVGFLPLVGMEPVVGDTSGSDFTSTQEPLPSSSGSNCSHLALKLEFSSKVVEHGKKKLLQLVNVFFVLPPFRNESKTH